MWPMMRGSSFVLKKVQFYTHTRTLDMLIMNRAPGSMPCDTGHNKGPLMPGVTALGSEDCRDVAFGNFLVKTHAKHLPVFIYMA